MENARRRPLESGLHEQATERRRTPNSRRGRCVLEGTSSSPRLHPTDPNGAAAYRCTVTMAEASGRCSVRISSCSKGSDLHTARPEVRSNASVGAAYGGEETLRADSGALRTCETRSIAELATGAPIESAATKALDLPDGGLLFAASDGMSGLESGEVASAIVLASLRQAMATDRNSPAEKRLEAAVRRANTDTIRAVLKLLDADLVMRWLR